MRVEGQCIGLDLDQLIIEFLCLVGDSADPGFQLDDVDDLKFSLDFIFAMYDNGGKPPLPHI